VLLYALVAILMFAPALIGERWFFPLHTDQIEPWRSDTPSERLQELEGLGNPALSDKHILFHADSVHWVKRLQAGEFALWNPLICGGVSWLGQALYGMLYPPNVVFLLVRPLESAYAVGAALHVLLACIGMFWFLRTQKLPLHAAWLGGLLFGISGPLIVRYHYYMTFYAVVWVPYLMASVQRFAETRQAKHLLAIPWWVALIFLSGFPQTGLYGIYLASIFGVLLLWRGNWRMPWKAALLLTISLAAGGLFSALQILPVVEVADRSLPRTQSVHHLVSHSATPWSLAGYLVADAWVDPREPWSVQPLQNPYWGAFDAKIEERENGQRMAVGANPSVTETSCYAGALALILVLGGLLRRDVKRLLPWLAALVLCWGYALGFRPLVSLTFHLLPGGQMGDVRRILPVTAMLVALLAAHGVAGLSAAEHKAMRWRTFWIGVGLAGLLAGTLAWLQSLGASGWWELLEKRQQSRFGMSLSTSGLLNAQEVDQLREASFELLNRRILRGLCCAGLALLALALASRLFQLRRIWLGTAVLATAALADLAYYHYSYNPFVPREGFLREPQLLASIPPGSGRLHRFEPRPPAELNPFEDLVLPANLAGHFGLEDAEGYIVAVPLRYARYCEVLAPDTTRTVLVTPLRELASLTSPLLHGAHVRYLLTRHDVPATLQAAGLDASGYELLAQQGENRLYLNQRVWPRAWITSSACCVAPAEGPQTGAGEQLHRAILTELQVSAESPTLYLEGCRPPPSATVLREQDLAGFRATWVQQPEPPPKIVELQISAEKVVVELEPGGAAFFFLADGFDPGWKATIDGAEAAVHPGNVAFRGLVLPAGARTLVLTYEPASVRLGGWISLVTVLGWVVALVFVCRPRQGAARESAEAGH
jgi:hypothetical protein